MATQEEEWSVRGYYWENYHHQIDDDYFKSFKTEEEAKTFYDSITKEKCDAGKVLYKEPYEEEMILEEEDFEEEDFSEPCLPDRCDGDGKCSMDKCHYEEEE